MKISVVIPAYNESAYIPETLNRLNRAKECVEAAGDASVEIIVVDNGSSDDTGELARRHGATVVFEPAKNIARARNRGALAASGDVLIFVDADTTVAETIFINMVRRVIGKGGIGGSVQVRYAPRRRVIRLYLLCWRLLARISGMVQGAVQFCTAEAFRAIRGYDERLYMGEDVDFYWRLRRYARRTGNELCVLSSIYAASSSRRFDLCSVWEILIWTNPVFIALFRKRSVVWRRWYEVPPR
jgi:glycosyltransferase involved in cell wall biosynthesis